MKKIIVILLLAASTAQAATLPAGGNDMPRYPRHTWYWPHPICSMFWWRAMP